MTRRLAVSRRGAASAVALATLAGAPLGCFPDGPDFAAPERLGGVRVLAVVPTPASGVPGGRVALQLEAFDARQHPALNGGADTDAGGAAREVEPLTVAWLGGCHNPPGDAYSGCRPLLERIAAALPSPLPLTASEVPESERELWGVGTRFGATVPPDVLEGRELDTNALPFGVSFAFFAVCRGRLYPAPAAPDALPLRCESSDGAPVGSDGFVRGFSTIYTYAGSLNQAPSISARVTRGTDFPDRACDDDADCAGVGADGVGSTCERPVVARFAGEQSQAPRRCLPSVPSCVAAPCAAYDLWPRLSPDSVEQDPAAAPPGGEPPDEIVWVKYYSLGGVRDAEALIHDRASGFNPSYAARWVAPGRPSPAPVPVWAVVQDNRGGVSVARWDFVVTE